MASCSSSVNLSLPNYLSIFGFILWRIIFDSSSIEPSMSVTGIWGFKQKVNQGKKSITPSLSQSSLIFRLGIYQQSLTQRCPYLYFNCYLHLLRFWNLKYNDGLLTFKSIFNFYACVKWINELLFLSLYLTFLTK